MSTPGPTVPGRDAAATLVAELADRLRAAGFADHAAAAARLTATPATPAAGLAVLAHVPTALALAPPSDLVDALAVVAGRAAWTQTASYVHDPPGPGFLDGYAHTTIAGGPADGAAVGALLLGPGVDYPRHHHPADEIYLPLTGARWVHGVDDDPTAVAPGVLVHHRPWQPHGMRTGAEPLLALYLWTGDVATPSTFCAG